MFKRNILIVAALLACAPAFAQLGTFAPNMPNIGGPSYCSSTNNAVCTNTVPAGPAVTGLETIPADTGLAGGQSPQSGRFTLPTIGGGTLDFYASLTGDTVTALNTTRQLIIKPAGTISALTVVFPVATTLVNGQRLGLCGTQIVTTLTMTAGTGSTISNPATAMLVPVATGAASCMEWIYRTADTIWYRVQ